MNSSPSQRSRTVTWQDPRATAAAVARLSGRALVEGLADGSVPPPPMAALVGIRVVTVEDGAVGLACTPDEAFYNPGGIVHGGLLCTVMDTAMGLALQTTLPAGTGFSTIEIKVSYLKAVRAGDGDLDVRGRVVRAGRRVAFAEGEVRDPAGALVGTASSSLSLAG